MKNKQSWIYKCRCGNTWKEDREPVSFLGFFLFSHLNYSLKEKWRPTRCPKCGFSPKSGNTKDKKQGIISRW